MHESHKEAGARVGALLVVVGLLILLATAVSSTVEERPFSVESQAATAVRLASAHAQPTATITKTTDTEEGEENKDKDVTDYPKTAVVSCPLIRSSISVKYACYQKTPVSDMAKLEQQCNPGFKYTINVTKEGDITVTPEALDGGVTAAKCGASFPAIPKCATENKTAVQSTSLKLCVLICKGEGDGGEFICSSASKELGKRIFDEKQLIGDITKEFEADAAKAALKIKVLKLSDTQRNASSQQINNAFKDVKEQIKNNKVALDSTGTFLASCSVDADRCTTEEVQLAELNYLQLEEKNAALEKQVANLAAAAKALNPEDSPQDEKDVEKETQQQSPTFNIPSDTFVPGAGQGGGNPISDLFKKLLGGKGGGGEPPAGNKDPKEEGTCDSQLVCSKSILYSRNTKCVDTQVHQCQFGCSESNNSCATSADPKEEDTPPTAEISCQPELADVGMSIAISYGCSAGTSEGDGFDTGYARSGSEIVVLSEPEDGGNKVFFGVTCIDKDLSSFKSCKVQMAKPAIALVAFPESVELNTTSTIGWVTPGGMEECVISSPLQSDFTARNADLKNTIGTAETDPITVSTDFVLTCETLGGQTRRASTTISVNI